METSSKPKYTKDDFLLIGAGFGRTGTSTIHAALGILGIHSYHMYEVEPLKHNKEWILLGQEKERLKQKLYKENPSAKDNLFDSENWNKCLVDINKFGFSWDHLFINNGITATLDHPASVFYLELLQYYKNAKVILSVRNDKKWYNSVRSTIHVISRIIRWRNWFNLLDLFNKYPYKMVAKATLWDLFFDDDFLNEESVLKRFNSWNESVKRNISPERLLVFDVKKDGWEKLCKFLDKDIPKDKDFPHARKSSDMFKIIQHEKLKCDIFDGLLITAVISAIGCLSYFGYKKYKN